VSASFPLNGRDSIAVSVNSEMISPLYCAPPSAVRYAGNSGMSMLKLAKNNKALTHSNQNCDVYGFLSANPDQCPVRLYHLLVVGFSFAEPFPVRRAGRP
jgi:hypothetical protein